MKCFGLDDEEQLRKEYEKGKAKCEQWEVDEDDENIFREALLQEMLEANTPFDVDSWPDIMARELGVFSKDEEYDYSKDMREAFSNSLKQTTEQRIFNTLPQHVFWDIKTPQMHQPYIRQNRYNPFRGREFENFFEMRASETYMDTQHHKSNINDHVSIYRKY